MPGDEQGSLAGRGNARRRVVLDDAARAGQEHLSHAVMGANRAAVVERLGAALLDAREIGLVIRAQAEFARDDFLGEVPFADEQRHDENARGEDAAQHATDGGLQLPETFDDLREDAATAEFIGVLVGRRGRIAIERRAVAHEHQGCVGKVIGWHEPMFIRPESGLQAGRACRSADFSPPGAAAG